MTTVKKVLFVFLGVYIVALTMGFLLPKQTFVSRSIVIEAPESHVFKLVGSHQNFQLWSPWANKDPEMSISYDGPKQGIGSKSMWTSQHPQVGNGSAEYIDYQVNSSVTIKLQFEQGGGDVILNLKQVKPSHTEVVWSFVQENSNVFARYISFFFLEAMLAPDLEQGLKELKSLAENDPVFIIGDNKRIRSRVVNYQSGDTELQGYIAQSVDSPNAPVVLVVHEWWGHNDYVRARADRLAALGYTAFAIDMYGSGKVAKHPDDAKAFMMALLSNREQMHRRFDGAIAYIKAQPKLESQAIAAIGYCFGGSVVLSMARQGRELAGAVSFHGSLGALDDISPSATSPVLVLNGEADPFVPMSDIVRFKQEMDESGLEYEFYNYAGAKHGFTSKTADKLGEQYDMPLAYDKAADEASWDEMQRFLAGVFSDDRGI